MRQRLLAGTLAALVASPAALAAAGTQVTIYAADGDALFSGTTQGAVDAGHALVHEQRTVSVQAGTHQVRMGDLPATLDPEAIAVAFGPGPAISVLGQRVELASGGTDGAIANAVGRRVTVLTSGDATAAGAGAGGSVTGTLVGTSPEGVLVRADDGALRLIHRYAEVTLPADAASAGSTLLLDVDARSAGARDAQLTYSTSGLGWRAAYGATLAAGADCRMQFKPEASIANRSGRDYVAPVVQLVAGQPNLGNRARFYATAAPMAAQTLSTLPAQAPLGDYRSFTLPGAVTLPSGTVTLTPLYAAQALPCTREYLIEEGGPGFPPHPNLNDFGGQDYKDRAVTSTLAFTAPEALPAGTLRAWTADRSGAPALLGQGGVVDTPRGQRVAVELGQSFDLRASRERTAFRVDTQAGTLDEAWRIALTNGGEAPRTVTLRAHPNRWREWRLVSSSAKPTRQTPQLLEFRIEVPAHGSATLDYAVRYAWSPKDL